METQRQLAQLGADILLYLLTDLDRPGRPFWGFVPDDPTDKVRISRAAAQLIESLSWLDCEEETFQRLQGLVEFLTQQATEDPEQIVPQAVAFSASRLKSVLQYCSYEKHPFCEHLAMAESIRWLVERRFSRPGIDIFTQLCVTDLLGYFVAIPANSSYAQQLDANGALLKSTRVEYKKLLAAIKKWVRSLHQPEDEPKDYSFALWLLFLGGTYGSRADALTSDKLLADLARLTAATESYDLKHRVGQPYRPHVFSRIVYPKLFLSWAQRKSPAFSSKVDLEPYYKWFITTARTLLEKKEDPYRLGLALKACIAAAKEDVRQCFREKSLEHSIRLHHGEDVRQGEASRVLLKRVIRDRLHVEIDEPKRLTGGWSAAQVWRVSGRYCLPFDSHDGQRDSKPFSFVVKTGQRSRFTDASRRYQALPNEGKRLFPRHDPEPSLISSDEGEATFYLIMEELRDYEPLARRVSGKVPPDNTAATALNVLTEAIRAGTSAIRSLHAIEPPRQSDDFATPRLTEVKIAEMYSLIETIKARGPRLRHLLRIPISIAMAQREYVDLANIKTLLTSTLNGVGRLVPARGRALRHTMTHGDCHGNNLMLPMRGAGQALFIDIDGLGVEDYLQDYAELISHICLSLDLEEIPDEHIELRIGEASGRARLDFNFGNSRFLEVQRIAFVELISAATSEAKERGDVQAMQRLALLIANRTLFIASKAPHEGKAAILLGRGLGFLENTYRWLTGNSAVPIPLTHLGPAEVKVFAPVKA